MPLKIKRWVRPLVFLLLSIAVSSAVSGCAVSNPQIGQNTELPAPLAAKFESGDIDFTCVAACSGRWGANKRTAKRYLILEQWENLSRLVIRIGFNSELSWYYLGRAAEGMNFHRAAIQYYARVLAISKYGSLIGHRCNGLFNNCDGYTFPEAAIERLKEMKKNSNIIEAVIPERSQLL